jgi:hypothetical protein
VRSNGGGDDAAGLEWLQSRFSGAPLHADAEERLTRSRPNEDRDSWPSSADDRRHSVPPPHYFWRYFALHLVCFRPGSGRLVRPAISSKLSAGLDQAGRRRRDSGWQRAISEAARSCRRRMADGETPGARHRLDDRGRRLHPSAVKAPRDPLGLLALRVRGCEALCGRGPGRERAPRFPAGAPRSSAGDFQLRRSRRSC